MENIPILIVIRRANHVRVVHHGVRVGVVLVISRVQRERIGMVHPVHHVVPGIIVQGSAMLPRHRLAMVMGVIHAAINHQTVRIQVLQHQTHVAGHVTAVITTKEAPAYQIPRHVRATCRVHSMAT